MKKVLLVGLLVGLFFVSACSKGKTKAVAEEVSNEKNEIVLSLGSEPDTGFDPTLGWGRYGSPLFQSTLLKRDDDLNIVNDLAEDYSVSEDGKKWVITLREDVKFSDNEPLTADDVKFTFEKAQENGSVVDLNEIEAIKVVDDYHLEFHLKQPQSTFVNSLVATGIVPEHVYTDKYGENPIGSGPFKLVQWDKGQQLIVEENQNYYGKKPNFKKITFLFLNEDASFAAAQSGQVDLTYVPITLSKKEVKGMHLEVVETVDNRGIVFPYVKSGERTAEGHPIGNDVTADLAIRQAINVAIDRQELVDGVLEGQGTPAFSSVDGLPWWNADTDIADGNIEEAKKILADAGWKDTDGDGIVEKDGLKAEFELYYLADDEIRQSLAITSADKVKDIGINMVLQAGNWDTIMPKMYSEAVLMGWGSHDPHELYNIYASENGGIEFNNTGYYSNDTVDGYFEKALRATTEEEAIEYWQKAQWDGKTGLSAKGDAPWAWLVNINHLYLVNDHLNIGGFVKLSV